LTLLVSFLPRKQARANAQTIQLQAETQLKNGGKATANDKQEKERELALVQVKKMVPSLKSAVKNGALFAAKVKAEPTSTVFNEGIQSAAPKSTQNLAWVEKSNRVLGSDLGVDVDEAQRIVKVMTPWADESRKVLAVAPKEDVLRELGAFVQMLAASDKMLKQMKTS